METSRELLMQFRESIAYQAERCENGDVGILDTLLLMKENKELLSDTIDLINAWIDDNMDEIVAEGEKYKEGYKGIVISLRSGSRRFVYKNIPEWQEADKAKKAIEAKYKAMFVAKEKGAAYAGVSDDGEELPMPDITHTKSGVSMKPYR